jgi:hypothetical protein
MRSRGGRYLVVQIVSKHGEAVATVRRRRGSRHSTGSTSFALPKGAQRCSRSLSSSRRALARLQLGKVSVWRQGSSFGEVEGDADGSQALP